MTHMVLRPKSRYKVTIKCLRGNTEAQRHQVVSVHFAVVRCAIIDVASICVPRGVVQPTG